MNKLVFVKIIVWILTVLLILGALTALRTIHKKVNEKPKSAEITLNQPKDSEIADYKIEKSNIYMLIKGKNISDRIIVVDSLGKNKPIIIKLFQEQNHEQQWFFIRWFW